MTAIDERHVEWATVDRMRVMLASVRRDYEITQTYTLFTSILCWVMQRVRWKQDNTILRGPVAALRRDWREQEYQTFLRGLHRPQPHLVGTNQTCPAFNDFREFDQITGTLDLLISLRDTVAHGDARQVQPVNDDKRLLGYRLHCARRERGGGIVWEASVKLDRVGMAYIAERVATGFCDAVIAPSDPSIRDAKSLREARG